MLTVLGIAAGVYGVGVVLFAALYLFLGGPLSVSVSAALHWPADVLGGMP
jgi:hypothetical protein